MGEPRVTEGGGCTDFIGRWVMGDWGSVGVCVRWFASGRRFGEGLTVLFGLRCARLFCLCCVEELKDQLLRCFGCSLGVRPLVCLGVGFREGFAVLFVPDSPGCSWCVVWRSLRVSDHLDGLARLSERDEMRFKNLSSPFQRCLYLFTFR